MAIEIIKLENGKAAFLCNTTDTVFGELFKTVEDAQGFIDFLGGADPRSLSNDELNKARGAYENQKRITAPPRNVTRGALHTLLFSEAYESAAHMQRVNMLEGLFMSLEQMRTEQRKRDKAKFDRAVKAYELIKKAVTFASDVKDREPKSNPST